jgi:GTP cyclohydrolase I
LERHVWPRHNTVSAFPRGDERLDPPERAQESGEDPTVTNVPKAPNREVLTAMSPRRREVGEADLARFERYMGEIFSALGLDLKTPGTEATPRRFIRAMIDSTDGYDGDPKLVTAFRTECHGGRDCELNQVVEGPIPFFSLCEHHALPFHGKVFVGYIAHEQIIGLSKLTRLVRLYARRFTVQERMGQQIVETLESLLTPHGVAVFIDAHHLCTQMRGVREGAPSTRTTMWRGQYAESSTLRSEFMAICGTRP